MEIEKMSNTELLALLVGKRAARNLGERRLSQIFGFGVVASDLAVEERAIYDVYPELSAARELIARCFLEKMESGEAMTSPQIVKRFLCSRIGNLEHEVFWCLWLDTRHRLIAFDEMFRGTLNMTSIYPREIVKRALRLNAAAVIFAHNHPSGSVEPSRSDELITYEAKKALDLVEVKVLDHFVVGATEALSFAERGLL